MTEDEKSLKPREKRRFGLRTAIFFWMTVFSLVIIAALWLSQTFFLDVIYKNTMQKRMLDAADTLVFSDSENFRQNAALLAERNQFSVSVYCVYESEGKLIPVKSGDSIELAGAVTRNITRQERDKLILFLLKEAKDEGGKVFYEYRFPEEKGPDSSRLLYASVYGDTNYDYLLLLDCSFQPADAVVMLFMVQLVLVSLLTLGLSVLLSLFLSRRIASPLQNIERAARGLPRGEYSGGENIDRYREISELSGTLTDAAEELRRTDRYQKELIANVSHDLRTPLTTVIGYGEVMRDIENERTPENMQVIIDEARRLSDIVSDLLTLSRYQSGAAEDNREFFDLDRELSETVERYRRMKAVQGFTFTYESDGEAEVYCDRVKIMQVFSNLVNNAVNYSGDAREISVFCRREGEAVRVTVKDHGIGIPENELPRIWERYYKVDKTHNRARIGSGIGLSIVKRILDGYKASYGVESRVGEGSSFWFILPLFSEETDGLDEQNL